MKYLSQFNKFDFTSFAKGKRFLVIGCSQWIDFETKQCLGTKIETVIAGDDTEYKRNAGDTSTNKFEKLSFKVSKQNLDIPNDSLVMPIDATASIWGDYKNQLSVKCNDIQVAQRKDG